METVLEILKTLLPSLFLFLTVWLVLRAFLNKEADVVRSILIRDTENRRIEVLKTTTKTLLPIRMQAYERMTLFCSRIELSRLIMNTNATEETPAELYKDSIVSQVEEEFNHNITQQVYMTDDLWNILILSKQEVTQICEKIYADLEKKYNEEGLEGFPKAQEFLDGLVAYLKVNPQIGYIHAMQAIKKETSILFN